MKKRVIAGAATLALAVAAMTAATPAPPAQAATAYGAFEIFYGPNCGAGGTASRVYTTSYDSTKYGEPWINDTFNNTRYGSKGAGQKIKNNAASMWIQSGDLILTFAAPGKTYRTYAGDMVRGGATSARICINFDTVTRSDRTPVSLRNHNTHFQFFKEKTYIYW